MRGEAERLARSFENDAKLASARVEALSASLDQLKQQAASSNEQDVQLRALERDAKSQRDLLESYLAKYREATARDSIGAASPDARIISTAIVSNTPSWPKKLPTVLIAAFGMLACRSASCDRQLLVSGSGSSVPKRRRADLFSPSLRRHAPPRDPSRTLLRRRYAPRPLASAPSRRYRGARPPVDTSPTAGKSCANAPMPTTSAAAAPALGIRAPSGRYWTSHQPDKSEPRDPTQRTPIDRRASAPTLRPAPVMDTRARALACRSKRSKGSRGRSVPPASPARRIAVVGARRNMGTTLAAISLARALAQAGPGRAGRSCARIAQPVGDRQRRERARYQRSGAWDRPRSAQIITRDRYSRVHVITAGQAKADGATIMTSQRLSDHARGARPQLRLCRGRRRRAAGDLAGAVCAACAARRAGRRRHRRAGDRIARASGCWRPASPMSACSRARRKGRKSDAGGGRQPERAHVERPEEDHHPRRTGDALFQRRQRADAAVRRAASARS